MYPVSDTIQLAWIGFKQKSGPSKIGNFGKPIHLLFFKKLASLQSRIFLHINECPWSLSSINAVSDTI